MLQRCCWETRAQTTAQLAHARVANASAPVVRQLPLTDETAFVRHSVAPAAWSLTARDVSDINFNIFAMNEEVKYGRRSRNGR